MTCCLHQREGFKAVLLSEASEGEGLKHMVSAIRGIKNARVNEQTRSNRNGRVDPKERGEGTRGEGAGTGREW